MKQRSANFRKEVTFVKKIVKLINNERINSAVLSNKANDNDCFGGALDICERIDVSKCDTYAYDYCSKEDRASCDAGADDVCTYDHQACSGPGVEDECYIDWD